MNINKLKIGDVCAIGDGAHASIKRTLDGIPYLTSKNFNSSGIILDKVDFISKHDYEKHFRENSNAITKPKNGDLIFSIIGSIGGAYLYKKEYEFGLSSSVAIIRPQKTKIIPVFLLYYLKSEFLQKWIESIKSGSAQGFLSLEMIRQLPLLLPPLPTQQKIALILSAYDDLIENNNQRIKLLEEMAEGIYKEWFVRMRFPGYKKAVFLDKTGKKVAHGTEGALPERWKEVKVKDFGKIVTGKTPSKKDKTNFNGEIPFIKTPDMQQGMFFLRTEESLSKKGADGQSSQYISENSISISCIGTVGKVGITTNLCQTNQQINTVIPKSASNLEYLYFSLLRLKPLIESYAATGATMANLSKSKFENIKLIEPTESIIKEFNIVTESIFKEIKILMQKNQILQETRDLLLPRLISGKLSVENINEYKIESTTEKT